MYHRETQVPTSSEPAEQPSINNQMQLPLTKVIKLHSEFIKQKKENVMS